MARPSGAVSTVFNGHTKQRLVKLVFHPVDGNERLHFCGHRKHERILLICRLKLIAQLPRPVDEIAAMRKAKYEVTYLNFTTHYRLENGALFSFIVEFST